MHFLYESTGFLLESDLHDDSSRTIRLRAPLFDTLSFEKAETRWRQRVFARGRVGFQTLA